MMTPSDIIEQAIMGAMVTQIGIDVKNSINESIPMNALLAYNAKNTAPPGPSGAGRCDGEGLKKVPPSRNYPVRKNRTVG